MTAYALKKFNVKNLDCASCALKIEQGLNQLDTIEQATLDFASLKLHVRTSDVAQLIREVKRINPGVILELKEPTDRSEDFKDQPDNRTTYNFYKEICFLLAAVTILGGHLAFEKWFQTSAFPYLEIIAVLSAYLLAGWKVLFGAMRTVRNGIFFDENVLMVIATIGAIFIHAYSEAIGVMVFYKIGELIQEKAVSRSRRSIKSLLAIKPEIARLKAADGIKAVSPDSVEVGDRIIVRPGDKVPLDGDIIEGTSQLDSSVLTGESRPIQAGAGDSVLAGQLNMTGALTIVVSRPFNRSSIAKIMEMVEDATARKANTEKFITTFARYYTPVVVLIAAGIAVVPPLVMPGATLAEWTYRALVLLVISCPCALVVSIPLGYFGGIGKASRRGILVKGANYLDVLARTKTIVFDKTGTLTRGVFKVLALKSANGFSDDYVLEMAAAAELHSNHPIAQSITAQFEKKHKTIDTTQIGNHFEIAGSGVQVQYGRHAIIVGNEKFIQSKAVRYEPGEAGGTVVYVAVDGRYAGHILIGDEIHPDAPKAVQGLKKIGVSRIFMLTGDNRHVASAVAAKLGLDGFYADLLPEEKVAVLEEIAGQNGAGDKTAFVGDGVNDAPAIARSDVGVAMGSLGSDAAIDTADVVLMDHSPFKMVEAVSIARHTRAIVWQNIVLAFVIKAVFIVFGTMGLANMWEAVFADVGTALIAVANSTRSYEMSKMVNSWLSK